MKQYILGIDTSCYTTSVAVADTGGFIVCDYRKLLEVKTGGRGLRQSEAVFQHIRQLPQLLEKVDKDILTHLSGVAVSTRPRDAEGSYMPVFCAGGSIARSVAAAAGVPVFVTDHQSGHIQAGVHSGGMRANEFLALHLSGGTLEVLCVSKDGTQIIGATSDISAGQFIDRVGVAMGEKFPAGPAMEKLAAGFCGEEIVIPSSVKGVRCSLSGPESKAQSMIGKYPDSSVAYSVFMCITRTVQKLISACVRLTGITDVLLVGGVASSSFFCTKLQERMASTDRNVKLYFCESKYSGDNAVGVALIGVKKYLE